MRKLSPVSLAVLVALGMGVAAAPTLSPAQVSIGVSVGFPPPALPIYRQPPCPGYGFIWTPGYWLWDDYDQDYFWVPGTWVRPPQVGYYWTPGYWGYRGGDYEFNEGYWGPVIGYYGGINYGFGYNGYGYEGGYWRDRDFYYNRSVNNISNTNITTIYNRTVINRTTINNISYNGGAGGIRIRPTPQQLLVARQQHFAPTPIQIQHAQLARSTPILRASANHGAPPIAATSRPTLMRGPNIVAARAGAPYRAPMANARGGHGPNGLAPNADRGPNSQMNSRMAPRPFVAGAAQVQPRSGVGGQFRPNAERAPMRGADVQHSGGQFRQGPPASRYQDRAPYGGMSPQRPAQVFRALPRQAPEFRAAPRPAQEFRAAPRPTQEFRAPPRQAQEFRAPPHPAQEFRAPPRQAQEFRPAPQARPGPQARPAPQGRPDRGGQDRPPRQ